MSPWLALDRVAWEEQRQQVKGHSYPSPSGTFVDTSMTPGENLRLLMGCRPPCLRWTRGAGGPGCSCGSGLRNQAEDMRI